MIIIGIDPGPENSGVAVLDTHTAAVRWSALQNNRDIRELLRGYKESYTTAIEMPASYGMSVGASVFMTCVAVGRFMECSKSLSGLVYRKTVATEICGQAKANGSMIRQAIMDMYGGDKAIGGVKCTKCKGKGWFGAGRPVCTQCVGTGWKDAPGPLYDVKSHAWDALAVAIAYAITRGYFTSSVAVPEGLGKNFQQPAHGYPTGIDLKNPIHQDEPF